MKKWVVFLTIIWTYGCGEPFKPETPHPSPERMQELLNAPVAFVRSMPTKFGLKVTVPVVFIGGSVALSCFVPESYGPGTIALGIVGQQMHASEIQSSQTRLMIDHVDQCGPLTALCVINTSRGEERASQDIEVKGGPCDGSQVPQSSRLP